MNTIQRAFTAADPDLEVVGGGHTDREIRRGPGLGKNFWPFGTQFDLRGGRDPSRPEARGGLSLGSATGLYLLSLVV